MATLYTQFLSLDLILHPVDLLIKDFGIGSDFLDTTNIDQLVKTGYNQAVNKMTKIKQLLKK